MYQNDNKDLLVPFFVGHGSGEGEHVRDDYFECFRDKLSLNNCGHTPRTNSDIK